MRTESSPSVLRALRNLLERYDLAALPASEYTLFGSAVRALWTRETTANVNVAFVSESSRAQFAAQLTASPFVVSSPVIYSDPTCVLRDADFTVCQIAFHDGEFLIGSHFFEHVAQRLLTVNRISPSRALISLLRTYKYASRGYGIPFPEFLRIIDLLPKDFPELNPEEVARHSGGVVIV